MSNKAEIQRLKDRLKAGGLTQAQFDNTIAKIQQLGGSVNPSNFPPPTGASASTFTQQASNQTSGSDAERIKLLKAKLASGGLSQADYDAAINEIRSLGGAVNPANFPQPSAPSAPAPPPAPPSTSTPSTPNPPQATSPSTQTPYTPPPNTTVETPSKEDVVDATADIKVKKPETGVEANIANEDFEANKNITYQNPTFSNPFGTQQVRFNDDGTIGVFQTLSPEQQAILDRDQQISTMGRDRAISMLSSDYFSNPFNPNVAQRASNEDLLAMRSRIEEDVFNRLNQNTDRDRQRAIEAKERELYNRGIPLDVRNPQYQREIEAINQAFNTISQQNRQQATIMGGDEFTRQFGVQEQLIANQYNQAYGMRNQALGELGAFSQLGTGLTLPQFQQYVGPNYQLQDPTDIFGQFKDIQQANTALNIEQQAVNQAGGGGGGGGYAPPPAPPNPFNNTTIPGV